MAMDMAQQQLEQMLASGQMQEQVFVMVLMMVLMVLSPAGLDGPDGPDGPDGLDGLGDGLEMEACAGAADGDGDGGERAARADAAGDSSEPRGRADGRRADGRDHETAHRGGASFDAGGGEMQLSGQSRGNQQHGAGLD